MYAPLCSVHSLGHSAALSAEAASGQVTDQSTSAFPESPARFHGKLIILDFDHNAVLETLAPSVLKLPVDLPTTKVQRFPGVSVVSSFSVIYTRRRQDS